MPLNPVPHGGDDRFASEAMYPFPIDLDEGSHNRGPWWAWFAERFGFPALLVIGLSMILYNIMNTVTMRLTQIETLLERRDELFQRILVNQNSIIGQYNREAAVIDQYDRDAVSREHEMQIQLIEIQRRLDDMYNKRGR